MTIKILRGDCREVLKGLPDKSVHCVVTSPPYFGLRDYGTGLWEGGDPDCDHKQAHGLQGEGGMRADRSFTAEGFYRDECRKCGARRADSQIGLEESPEAFADQMVMVFREVRRVLRDDGVLWLNLGDSYAASRGYQVESTKGGPKHGPAQAAGGRGSKIPQGLKPKDLIGIPWLIAFALRADGWYLRQDVIWNKPNPMPESVADRCTKAHEYLFLFSKSERYFFDQTAISEPARDVAEDGTPGRGSGNKARKSRKENGGNQNHAGAQAFAIPWEGATRNKRSVWTVSPEPFSGKFCTACGRYFDGRGARALERVETEGKVAYRCQCGRTDGWLSHFATFPTGLIEPCIAAGTSEAGVCGGCGAPFERKTEKVLVPTDKAARNFVIDDRDAGADPGDQGSNRQKDGHKNGHAYVVKTICWLASCACGIEPEPATVLDPFGGAGTTGLVADRMGRASILIELNPHFAAMAERRIEGDSPLFSKVGA